MNWQFFALDGWFGKLQFFWTWSNLVLKCCTDFHFLVSEGHLLMRRQLFLFFLFLGICWLALNEYIRIFPLRNLKCDFSVHSLGFVAFNFHIFFFELWLYFVGVAFGHGKRSALFVVIGWMIVDVPFLWGSFRKLWLHLFVENWVLLWELRPIILPVDWVWFLTFVSVTHDLKHDVLLQLLFLELAFSQLPFVVLDKFAGFELGLVNRVHTHFHFFSIHHYKSIIIYIELKFILYSTLSLSYTFFHPFYHSLTMSSLYLFLFNETFCVIVLILMKCRMIEWYNYQFSYSPYPSAVSIPTSS